MSRPRSIYRAMLLATAAMGAVLILGLAGGCSGRAARPGDGGPIGNGDGPSGDCTGLTEGDCTADSACFWFPGCQECSSQSPQGSCLPAGSPVACPAIACLSCAGLDETTCASTPSCRADYCQECSCSQTFVGCSNATDPPGECPGLGCDPQCDCTGLDEASCMAAGSRCTVGTCPGCNGQTSFVGCFDQNANYACPAVACDGCRTSQDCQATGPAGGYCATPGSPPPCGICKNPPDSCMSDAECQTNDPPTICAADPNTCTCGMQCLPGCQADSDCGEGLSCQNLRCSPTPCAPDGTCPSDFYCADAAGCQRSPCNSDTDCAGGSFCVDGACYGSLGTCQVPVP